LPVRTARRRRLMPDLAFLRPRLVAELLGVTERTVRRWIADGTLPSVKVGGARLIARDALEQQLGASLDLPWEVDDEEF
jgi:excisionase family DNA binding protein